MTETPYNPLARLSEIQKTLTDSENRILESRLIGALSTMVDREHWEHALYGAALIFPQTHSLFGLPASDPLPTNLPQFEGFEYTGEYRIPAMAEWFVADSEHADPAQWDNYENVHPLMNKHGFISQPRYILRKLPAVQSEAIVSNGGTGGDE